MQVLLGITGSSGSIYAQRLLEVLVDRVERVFLLATPSGRQVVHYEIGSRPSELHLGKLLHHKVPAPYTKRIIVLRNDDFFSSVASGSTPATHMVVLPCSMGSLARIRHGLSTCLLERAADVMLKERLPLIICPRETPMGVAHLEAMTDLAKFGAQIVPLMPGFYHHPKTMEELVDFMVARVMSSLKLEHDLVPPWNQEELVADPHPG